MYYLQNKLINYECDIFAEIVDAAVLSIPQILKISRENLLIKEYNISDIKIIKFKSLISRRSKQEPIAYILKKKEGPAHSPRFEIEVYLKGIKKFSSVSKTIKDAEIAAAKKMVDFIFKNKLL